MKRQLDQMAQQTELTEASNRPWIKIVDIEPVKSAAAKDPPAFQFWRNTPGVQTKDPVRGASISIKFTVKNIGKSVAQDIKLNLARLFNEGSVINAVNKQEEKLCAGKDYSDLMNTPNNPRVFLWSALFPDETFVAQMGTMGPIAKEAITRIKGTEYVNVDVIGCVTDLPPFSPPVVTEDFQQS